ncbi:MAG TPA: hypothetical protein VF941_22440, partial [Clostridia bacterium]
RKVHEYFMKNGITNEVYSKYGVTTHHTYPSIIGYISHFFLEYEKKIPGNVEAELERVLKSTPKWRGHSFYFLTPLYFTKELVPLMVMQNKNSMLEELLDRMYLSQNKDLGFGYSTCRTKTFGLPTALALRSGVYKGMSEMRFQQAANTASALLNLQKEDGSWESGTGTMVAPQPDEYTAAMKGIPGLWNLMVFLVGKGIIKYCMIDNYRVFGDSRFPGTLFFPCSVTRYCTRVFPTVQALMGLLALRKEYEGKIEA